MICITKAGLPDEIVTRRTTVRKAKAGDLDEIATWPGYPPPYHGMSMDAIRRDPDGLFWWQQFEHPDRCHYAVVSGTGEVVGIHAFARIDWTKGVTQNMGCRIRPDVCDMGYGTETLGPLLANVLAAGMAIIRLDVVAGNSRAVRCYEKCGMRLVDRVRDENLWYEQMEMSATGKTAACPNDAESDRIVVFSPEIVTGRLKKFAHDGDIEYPVHALLYAIGRTKTQAAYADIFEHALLSYDGDYTFEEFRVLKDILRTFAALDSPVSREIMRKCLGKFSETKAATPDVGRLIRICRDC